MPMFNLHFWSIEHDSFVFFCLEEPLTQAFVNREIVCIEWFNHKTGCIYINKVPQSGPSIWSLKELILFLYARSIITQGGTGCNSPLADCQIVMASLFVMSSFFYILSRCRVFFIHKSLLLLLGNDQVNILHYAHAGHIGCSHLYYNLLLLIHAVLLTETAVHTTALSYDNQQQKTKQMHK